MQGRKIKNTIKLLPFVGATVFFILYYISAQYYPGGSMVDPTGTGFSWQHNFWCNLLDETALNGEPNDAKPIATAAMIVLCLSLAFCFSRIPFQLKFRTALSNTIRYSGILAMAISLLLLTSVNHDLASHAGALCGMIALGSMLTGLYSIKWFMWLISGLFNISLMVLNAYLYHHKTLIFYLPVVQKITFAVLIIWIIALYQASLSVRLSQKP